MERNICAYETRGGVCVCVGVEGCVDETARGLVRLRQLVSYEKLKTHTWFFSGSVVVYKGGGTKKKSHCTIPELGSKINVFGLQMAHKGILIYSTLWCVTAKSDISNGAGVCSGKLVALGAMYSKVRLKIWFLLFSFAPALNQNDRNAFHSGWVKPDRYYVDQREDELSNVTVLTAVCGNQFIHYLPNTYPLKGSAAGRGGRGEKSGIAVDNHLHLQAI